MSVSIRAAMTVAPASAPPSGARFAVAPNSPKTVEPVKSPIDQDPPHILVLLDGPRLKPALIQQIFWLRLEGLEIAPIARVTGCSRTTVAALVNYWQYQAAHATQAEFKPLAHCPRRAAARNRKIRRPAPARGCPAKKKATLSVQT